MRSGFSLWTTRAEAIRSQRAAGTRPPPPSTEASRVLNFLTIGHRGVMGVEPENTLRSFVAAQEAGLDVIELDLHLSKDGALVVMHDARVDRTTDGTGAIADKTLDELRALDAGRGERVPLFTEVLDAVRTPLQAEIKDVRAARALAEVMNDRGWPTAWRSRPSTTRRSPRSPGWCPGCARRSCPASPTPGRPRAGDPTGTDVVDRAVAVGASRLCLNIRRITLEIVEHARKADLSVFGWVVNTQDHLRLVRALGLDGATTDYPEIKRTGRFTA